MKVSMERVLPFDPFLIRFSENVGNCFSLQALNIFRVNYTFIFKNDTLLHGGGFSVLVHRDAIQSASS